MPSATAKLSLGKLTILIAGGPGNARDWVGLFRPSDGNTLSIYDWVYLANDAKAPRPKTGKTANTIHLNITDMTGDYEVRLMSAVGESTYDVICKSDKISFTGTPSAPDTPKTITLVPSSLSIPANSTSGAIVSNVTVTMTNGTAFTGTLSITPTGMIGVSGNKLILTRGLATSDVGTHQFQTTATQNGVSISATLSLTVTTVVVEPPPLSVPIEVTFIPSSVIVTDNSLTGTFVTFVSVKMSDSSTFTGTLKFVAPNFDGGGLFKLSGKDIVLARNLTSTDDGIKSATVEASQGGVTLVRPFSVTVVSDVIIPGSPSIVLDPSITRPSTGEFPVSNFKVNVTNGPGKAGDRVVIYNSTGSETGRYVTLSAGQSNVTVTLNAPSVAGNWTVRFISSTGAQLDSKPLQTATLTTKQLFPILNPGSQDNAKVNIYRQDPPAANSWQQTCSGNVVFGVSFFSNGGSPPPDGTVTMRWMVDDVPVSPYIVGPPFPYTLDTTTLTEGTHAVSILFVDSTHADFNRPSLAYQLRPVPLIIIVANKGYNDGVQTVPSTDRAFSAGGIRSSAIDYVKYPATPLHVQTYPYPTKFISGSSDASLWDRSKWYLECIDRNVEQEYETIPRFCKTSKGGVFVGPFASLRTNEITGSYNSCEKNYNWDGLRNDNMTDAYSNAVPTPDGTGFTLVDLAGGVYTLDWTGARKTIVGRWGTRSKLPFDFQDNTLDEATINANHVVRGTLEPGFDTDFGGANDVCYDPRNDKIIYVAQTLDHCIYKADLSVSPPFVTRYAGQLGIAGYVEGDARTVALFNEPYSICMTKDGTMYVADRWNYRIRVITPDGKIVSTLFGKQDSTLPTKAQFLASEFDGNGNYEKWCPSAITSFANSYALAPQVLRVTSIDNLVLGESWSMAARYIDLTAKTTHRIGIFGAKPNTRLNYSDQLIHANGQAWFWLDANRAGTCGPVDDIVMFHIDSGDVGAAAVIWRLSIDGSKSQMFGGDTGYAPTEGGYAGGGGHYPWVVAISDKQGRILTTGTANFGMFCWRIKQPEDPIVSFQDNIGIDRPAYLRGRYIHQTGSCANFPWGCRPGFGQLRGPGTGMLGISGTEPFDTLMTTYPDDTSLGTYIQSGFGGTVPRPELTGDDLADLIYFIRRTSLPGSYPTPIATRAQFATDIVPPIITNLVAIRLTSPNTRIQVTWTTDTPTYGFVAAGSPASAGKTAPYHRCQLESWEGSASASYRTTHDVIIDDLPSATPTHLVVLSKDMAGNSVSSIDKVVP